MDAGNFHIGAGDLKINGVSVGHTTPEGVLVNIEPDVHLHLSGKWGTTPVKAALKGYMVTVQVTMGETTLANLQDVVAGANQDAGKLQLGGLAGREIPGVELTLEPFDGTENWYFTNAVPSSPVEVAYQVENERVYQVTFTAMVDENAADDENIGYAS